MECDTEKHHGPDPQQPTKSSDSRRIRACTSYGTRATKAEGPKREGPGYRRSFVGLQLGRRATTIASTGITQLQTPSRPQIGPSDPFSIHPRSFSPWPTPLPPPARPPTPPVPNSPSPSSSRESCVSLSSRRFVSCHARLTWRESTPLGLQHPRCRLLSFCDHGPADLSDPRLALDASPSFKACSLTLRRMMMLMLALQTFPPLTHPLPGR